MATEKKRSKGRFLYLFDWNAKSRKKLFSNKIETDEGSIHGKDSVDDFEVPHYLLEHHENNDGHSFRGSGNYSCASSVSGDDGYGTKAPGVVARLMGLDTMPTIPSCEANTLTSYDSRGVGHSYHPKSAAPIPLERHNVEYSYMPVKLEGLPWSSMDPRRTKINGRLPIERFQTEVLPPKSAKPISITHHKLLSPIKSPGFVPTKDAAYIMEAAARILDSSPQPTGRAKIPTLGSPSSSFKMKDLKDKLDAAQRSSRLPEPSKTPKQSTPVKQARANSSGKSSHRSLFKNILRSETSSSQKTKIKGKSVSLPVRDKAMQKKEGSISGENRSQLQKEHKQVKLKQKESNMLQVEQTRTSKSKRSGVLRQNNDKQNSANHKEKSTSKPSILDQQPRKAVSGDKSAGPSKVIHKVYVNSENRPKKLVATSVTEQRTPLNGVVEKRASLNRIKNIVRDKPPVRDSKLSENAGDKGDRRALQSDLSLQGDSRKEMDVISFTFTSPIKKPSSQSMSSIEDIRSNSLHVGVDSPASNGQSQSHTRSSSSPLLGLSLIDSGSLSLLLEQKLKELTDKIVPTKCESQNEGRDTDSVSCVSETIPSHDVPGAARMDDNGSSDKDEKSLAFDDDCSLPLATKASPMLEDVEGIVEHGVTKRDTCEARVSDLTHLDIFVPECSVSGSCMSSNTISDIAYGYDQPSSPQSQEVISCISTESIYPREDESDYTDAASYWEPEYVSHVVHYAGLKRLEDHHIVDPSVFDLLENLINNSGMNVELCSKLERRVLFDCVSEIVSSRHERVLVGSHREWVKWGMLVQNDWLTEEVYREIVSLQCMGNLMVDELVERDMSTPFGKWLDFEIESLEEGVEIEEEIISSLVDELVDDLYIL